jgi:hypothetical protein
MKTQETTESRELTAHELDGVAGGYSALIVWAMYGSDNVSDNVYTSEVGTRKR